MLNKQRIFVLDTNVLVHDPTSLYAFGKHIVALPISVLEELDSFKSENSDRGRNSRDVIRRLDELRERGALNEGVLLDNGGILRIVVTPSGSIQNLKNIIETTDSDILATALYLKNQDFDVVFISKDINARVKADVIGIAAQDYLRGHVTPDEFYKGWIKIEVPASDLQKDFPEILKEINSQNELLVNQFVWLVSKNNEFNYRVWRYIGSDKFEPVYPPSIAWPLQARNPQQLMALNILMEPSINLVCLLGPAGTGKTFLALLAGLHHVLIARRYQKILIARPVVPLGQDIGYLPGDIHEKLRTWMQPIYDNIGLITHEASHGEPQYRHDHLDAIAREGGRRKKKHQSYVTSDYLLRPLEYMIKEDKLSLEAITYMRGRSIPYQYIFIDEVQNLSPHEVKTIITRVGEGSKIILSGDPYQIDSPYLDFSSNGLVVASNAFKGHALAATVYLDISERSELSKLAGELL